jgi:hypothetical protein
MLFYKTVRVSKWYATERYCYKTENVTKQYVTETVIPT